MPGHGSFRHEAGAAARRRAPAGVVRTTATSGEAHRNAPRNVMKR